MCRQVSAVLLATLIPIIVVPNAALTHGRLSPQPAGAAPEIVLLDGEPVVNASTRNSPKGPSLPHRKFCLGTDNSRNTITVDGRLSHYERLKKSYVRCRRIVGNLEITHINQHDLDNDFVEVRLENGSVVRRRSQPFRYLEHVEEITGYLLIFNVQVKELSLPKLKIIWGEKKHEGNAVQIESSSLQFITLPSLRSIEEGNVTIKKSSDLCYMDPAKGMVDYAELLGGEDSDYSARLRMLPPSNASRCGGGKGLRCSAKCAQPSCFGPADNQCQVVYRRVCLKCESKSCYLDEEGASRCCDETCAGGCYGDGKDNCVACKRFEQDGRCVNECNGIYVYKPNQLVKEELPIDKRRYFYGRHCVAECPENYCVARCSPGYYRNLVKNDQRCVPCVGDCPKICQMTERLNALNIGQLVNCSEIEGNIEILNHIFEPYTDHLENGTIIHVPALSLAALDVLKSVRVVTGFVVMDGGGKNNTRRPTSMEFLENLEMIEGRHLYYEKYSLYVIGNMDLKWLGLRSLKRIKNGLLSFTRNAHLCYSDYIPFRTVFSVKDSAWRNNAALEKCAMAGRRCHATCDHDGCWGPGPGMCVHCKDYIRDGVCAAECPREHYFLASVKPKSGAVGKNCVKCHPECHGCRGTRSTDCEQCRNFEYWTRRVDDSSNAVLPQKVRMCVASCPNNTYTVPMSHGSESSEETGAKGRCEPCHDACYTYGCTGPSSVLGPGGCTKCHYAVEEVGRDGEASANTMQCLLGETEELVCGAANNLTSHFLAFGPPNTSKYLCQKCRRECGSCTRDSSLVKDCDCLHYRLVDPVAFWNDSNSHLNDATDQCVNDCGRGSFTLRNESEEEIGLCGRCHPLCDEQFSCDGVESTQCHRCALAGIRINETAIECLEKCPPDQPYYYEAMCHDEDKEAQKRRRRNVIIGSAIAAALFFAIVTTYLVYRCTKYRKKYEKETMMHMPNIPPLDPRKMTQRPNMRRLILIAADDLDASRNTVLGRGAFGVVYAGKWKPPSPYSGKWIPVAIKAIGSLGNSNEAEMIREAGLMGSIQHEHLLPLVGICVAGGIKIVTILRPLGCLQKFLDQHKTSLGSKQLMVYAYQISLAMEFLTKKKIVHRDLAARNVLVRNINHVEVTDFGLAQMLQGQETSVVVQGRVAAKWLAIESLRHQIYNERTDVWSYGVTVWEILTFGSAPYKELQLPRNQKMHRELAEQLERGYRLAQPDNCSTELYQELLNCWLLDPESRPTFRKLRERFEDFCRAPHIYIQERQATKRMDSISSFDQRAMIERLLHDNDFLDPVDIDPADYTPHSPLPHHARTQLRRNHFFPANTTSSVGTVETVLTPALAYSNPTTPTTRPLLLNVRGDRSTNGSTATDSTRYKSDPTMDAGRRLRLTSSTATTMTSLSGSNVDEDASGGGHGGAVAGERSQSVSEMDDESYLAPRNKLPNGGPSGDIHEQSGEEGALRNSNGLTRGSGLYTPVIEEDEETSGYSGNGEEMGQAYVNEKSPPEYINGDSPRSKLLTTSQKTPPPRVKTRKLRFNNVVPPVNLQHPKVEDPPRHQSESAI